MGSRGGGTARSRQDAQRALDEFDELAGLRGGGGEAGDARTVYVLEHLATFTVTRETGIVYPADGMRRLLQLEKTNGIWSQKMQLCLEGQWVLVMDYETGSIMERFPASWVHSPTAFTSPEPAELYNNVLAFVVGAAAEGGAGGAGGGGAGGAAPRRELHIFQCHDVSAQALVEELNALKGVSGGGAGEGARDFVIERERERERENDAERPRRQQMSAQLGRSERGGSGGERDDASSTGSERLYEQDIAILNRCFDDIEKFIARLQHAAAAQRELERRRRSRGRRAGGAGAGEGMLALRTRPPPERDFVDVLQKFKLSFNLLARLRAHIHDPNAPELVHFLFTPLALIVDAAQDAADGRLPARVVQPLLTRDALNLLANCVTSKETELWHSLGDAWLIPREQWKTAIPPYQPVFMDGWSPDYQVDDQPLRRNMRAQGREDSGSAASSPDREPYRADRDEDDLGEAWARGVMARGGRVVRVTYPRTANNDKELTVVRGEYLEVLDDSRKWWKARNRRGVTAHVPHTIVAPAASPPASPHLYPNPIYTHYQEGAGGRGSGGSSPTGPAERSAPPPPPPPPPPPAPPADPPRTSTDTIKSTRSMVSSGGGDLQEELKMVLPAIQQRKNKLDIKKTPDIFIDQKSNPDEVAEWLEAKGFSASTRRALRMPGHQLFALTRPQLEQALGADEGKRLYSQILVQRNVSGYKTTSASELQSILRKAREKVEVS
ncbi:epidermal growth factor receptor kinase substrate 8-like protein 1 isoform X4 [Helicoverpa zea]|uniref:epidermal growth factor receptor kinase substrate 8-like protein 1 isoform X4 n=1 Tax=Helicoverpa zea TaxID=7113 RepID=UPI001F5A70D6|nr:epidermal growth factor receptor kinase substrate 8-like protein 1 isoform X4 [Helicoverpa zea]